MKSFFLTLPEGEYPNYHTAHDWHSFCGDTAPAPLAMPGQQTRVIFQADPYVEGKGFKLNVETRDCGGVFGASGLSTDVTSGYVASPNYPKQSVKKNVFKV